VTRSCYSDVRERGTRLLVVLTVSPHGDEDAPAYGYPATRASYEGMGFLLVRDLLRKWPNRSAAMMVRPLERPAEGG